MREKRLDIATSTNYATGGAGVVGTPTKVAPPASHATDGVVPGLAFGSQWENYIHHYLQKQIEISSQVPFRNWIEFTGMSSIAYAQTSRFAFNKYIGMTFMVRGSGAGNSWYYLNELPQPSAGAPQTYPVTPAVGTFVARGVAAIEDPTTPSWLVVGSNATDPTKTLWKILPFGVSDTEVVSPVSGAVELICKDKTTGYFYAFAADANRSVLVHGPATSDTWSVLGQRGAGAPAPSAANMYCAAANGLLYLAYTTTPGSTQATVEKITTGAFTRTALTPFSSTSAILDVIFSPQIGAFMLLTKANTYRFFSDPALGFETFPHSTPYSNAIGSSWVTSGCLHETGSVYQDGNVLLVTSWLGDAPHLAYFADFGIPSSSHVLRFDGSAIWMIKDESSVPRVFRSLRSN